MVAFTNDIRHSLRAIAQQPGNSLLIVGVLALGLAGVFGMLSILKAMVWSPLPFPAADRLVQVGWRDRAADFPDDVNSLRGADLLDWRERLAGRAVVAGQGQASINLASGDTVERHDGAFVTANLFSTLGVAPTLGRDFLAEDEQPGAAPVVVLSHDLWRNRFGADPAVVGREVRVNAMPATIIGVMPPRFNFPFREQIWVAASLSPTIANSEDRQFEVFIEPRTEEAAMAPIVGVLEGWIADAQQREPGTWMSRELAMLPMNHYFTDPPTRRLFHVMLMTVALVLLVACANVANMLLARTLARSRDLAVRLSLGATRTRVARLLLGQSLTLTLIATLTALPLAQFGIDWIVSSFDNTDSGPPSWMNFDLDAGMIASAATVGAITALLVGILPVARLRVDALGQALRDGGRAVVGGSASRLSRWLVAGELALACVVLLTTLVMVRGVERLERIDLGIDPTNLLTARIALFSQDYPDDAQATHFIEQFTDTLRREPGVINATATTTLPGLSAEQESMRPEGFDTGNGAAPPVRLGVVDPAFINTLAIELRAGRGIDSRDRADTDPVIVIDERFARTIYPNSDPLGRRVKIPADGAEARWYTIVGIIEVMQLEDVGDAELPSALMPLAQNPRRIVSVVVRTRDAPALMKPRFQELLRIQDPDTPAYWLRTYEEVMRVAMAGERVLSGMFGAFGLAALVLAGAGLYGLIAQLVGQRTREIGVQRALGANGAAVLRNILRSTMPQVLAGIGVGMLLAVPFANRISSILPEVTLDASAVLLLMLILGSVATVAVWVPARRALAVDPSVALRCD